MRIYTIGWGSNRWLQTTSCTCIYFRLLFVRISIRQNNSMNSGMGELWCGSIPIFPGKLTGIHVGQPWNWVLSNYTPQGIVIYNSLPSQHLYLMFLRSYHSNAYISHIYHLKTGGKKRTFCTAIPIFTTLLDMIVSWLIPSWSHPQDYSLSLGAKTFQEANLTLHLCGSSRIPNGNWQLDGMAIESWRKEGTNSSVSNI